MQTTNVYKIIIKSNDTLFVFFITTTHATFIYTGKVIVWSFIAFQEWSKIKTEKKFVSSFIVFYLKEFLDRTECSYN